ncbi:MAG: lysine--tRNA ligase [Lentisphaeria bacterium]
MSNNEQINQAENHSNPPADQRLQRLQKLEELVAAGVQAYGGRVDDITSTPEAIKAFEAQGEEADGDGKKVRLAGRLTAMRVMGKSIFADIRDRGGRLQIYVKKNQVGEEAFSMFKKLDLGDILAADGSIFRTRKGEITQKVESFQLLSKALRPLPEKWHGLTDTEQRYRQRYLDLISNEDVQKKFRLRAQFMRELRRLLDERGFTEVETPMLQPIPGGAAARPFETYYTALDCPMYLRIAPELYLKRLLVGGMEKVYEINRNFRNEGLSRHHNPEFTMIEVYEAYSDCSGMMELVEYLVSSLAENVLGTTKLPYGEDSEIDISTPWRRVTYAELIREQMGDDWYEVNHEDKLKRADKAGLSVVAEMSDSEITHEVYEKIIEATLIEPTFVTRLPAELVPLAKTCKDDPSVVDVFELEIGGQEIAPGYSELNNPLEQRHRFEEQLERTHGTVEEVSSRIDEDFLTAMEHGMPPAGGMGIGIDRLLMLLTNSASIRDIIMFPQLRPKQ